jgi:hypothetical protein
MAQFSQPRYGRYGTMTEDPRSARMGDPRMGDTRTARMGDTRTARMADYRYADGEWPQGPEIEDVRSARVSVWATLGLMVGLVGLGLSLTGLLAPEGVAVAGLGLAMSVIGLVTTRLPAIAGRGLAVLGLLLSLAAGVLGGIAMTGEVGWLASDVNQVSRVHGWLVDRWSWLERW